MGTGLGHILHDVIPICLYLGAFVAMLLSLFGRPQIGLYYLVPLLPLQTTRFKLFIYPLGGNIVDLLLLCVLVGGLFQGLRLRSTPVNRMVFLYMGFLYVSLWRGAIYLSTSPPLWISDRRLSDLKDFLVMPLLFFAVLLTIRTTRQMKILLVLMCLVVFAVDKSFMATAAGHDFSHFAEEKRDAGALGFAGVNGLAAFEVLWTAILLGLLSFEKKKWTKLFYLLLIGFNVYCILFAFSRGAYLGLLVVLFVYAALRSKKLLIPLVAFCLLWQVLVPTAVKERVTMTYEEGSGLEVSAEARVKLWTDAVNLIASNPIFGTGYNTYAYLHRVEEYQDTHNYYIKVLVETGFPGLLLFLWLLGKFMRLGWKMYRESPEGEPLPRSLGLGFMLCLTGLIVVNIFGDRFTFIEVDGFFWVSAGMVASAYCTATKSMEEDNGEPSHLEDDLPKSYEGESFAVSH